MKNKILKLIKKAKKGYKEELRINPKCKVSLEEYTAIVIQYGIQDTLEDLITKFNDSL